MAGHLNPEAILVGATSRDGAADSHYGYVPSELIPKTADQYYTIEKSRAMYRVG